MTIEVEEVIKGTSPATLERRGSRLSSDELSPRVLVIGDQFAPLGDDVLKIPTANGVLLSSARQVVAHIQEVLRSHPAGNVAKSFSMPIPKELAGASVPRMFDNGMPGPPRQLQVPVDAQLEAWARQRI